MTDREINWYLVLLLQANQPSQIFGDDARLTDAFLFHKPRLFLFVILPQLEKCFGILQTSTTSFGLLFHPTISIG